METIEQHHFPRSIRFARPQATQAISVTGERCELNCAHCGGHYLKHMTDLADIRATGDIRGGSCLVSGGCTRTGKVPIADHLAKLTTLKQDRRFNLHVGLVDDRDIEGLAAIADKVSFDFVGDNETIREVFGNGRTVEEYVRCYRKLRKYCHVTPHICVGLYGGRIQGEYRALELLRELGAEGLTFIVFTPTRGTKFAQCQPPDISAVVELLARARQEFSQTPIHLGCMRPGGRYRTEIDQWAVLQGVDTIVNPTPAAVRLAEQLGLSITWGEECCVL